MLTPIQQSNMDANFLPKNIETNKKESSQSTPDNRVHGANIGPILVRQDPAVPYVGPMNFAIWDCTTCIT